MQRIAISPPELLRLQAACAAGGGEPQPPSAGEAFRIRTPQGVALARICEDGAYALSPAAFGALQKLRSHAANPIGEAAVKLAGELMIRDGRRCFYCDTELRGEAAAVEHLLPRSRGGSDDLANLALSCRPCLAEVGDRPVVQKIRFRDERRMRREAA